MDLTAATRVQIPLGTFPFSLKDQSFTGSWLWYVCTLKKFVLDLCHFWVYEVEIADYH